MRDAEAKRAFAELAQRAAAGDQPAFRQLVAESHRTVYRLALRLLDDPDAAEDVVQETFIRAWQGLATVRDPNAAFGWICRVARNVARDRQRAQYRQPTRRLDAAVGNGKASLQDRLADPGPGPEQALGSAELDRAVRLAMAGLKEKHRLVLTLREMDGMSYEEIAEALGCRIGTVESRLHRARKELARRLAGLVAELSPDVLARIADSGKENES